MKAASMQHEELPTHGEPAAVVRELVRRARAAQRVADSWSQERTDEVVMAAGWAIIEPERNRALAEIAVRDTGLGNVADKIAKNRRKTMGLLRDLQHARSVGVIAEDRERGIVEIARPVGVVAAITPRPRAIRPLRCCSTTSMPSSTAWAPRAIWCRRCRGR
jgi:sulfoacetaldehyde dehydrogenase